MRFFTLLFGLIFVLMGTQSFAQSNIKVKGKVPQGVIIQNNKVILKKGYVFEKKSGSKVISKMRGGGTGISGEFDCTCNGETGGCSAVTTPNSVTCVSNGCTNCYMIVTIPDPKPAVMHR
jgi:hypothetical protein